MRVREMSGAKWSYVTRRVTGRGGSQLGGAGEPRLGDLIVASVESLGAHERLENIHGRRVCLYPGDVVVGAYGNRYATDFYEGYLPTGPAVHLLTSGGVVGTVASANTRRSPPTELKVLGALTDQDGAALSVEDFMMPVSPPTTATL